jgi:hypothetical protein
MAVYGVGNELDSDKDRHSDKFVFESKFPPRLQNFSPIASGSGFHLSLAGPATFSNVEMLKMAEVLPWKS